VLSTQRTLAQKEQVRVAHRAAINQALEAAGMPPVHELGPGLRKDFLRLDPEDETATITRKLVST
jgi:hypothetical protein